jgi:hypothetical protein
VAVVASASGGTRAHESQKFIFPALFEDRANTGGALL